MALAKAIDEKGISESNVLAGDSDWDQRQYRDQKTY